ncbi:mCG148295 [Mus musculus]|nr:mCG148295 [Mus musculus]
MAAATYVAEDDLFWHQWEGRELIRESEQCLAWNKDLPGGKVSSGSSLKNRAKRVAPRGEDRPGLKSSLSC